MNETTWPPSQRWLDADGTPIPMDARAGRAGVDIELGALRSRHGEQGQVPRPSATRLVVRFDGETTRWQDTVFPGTSGHGDAVRSREGRRAPGRAPVRRVGHRYRAERAAPSPLPLATTLPESA